LYLDDTDGVGAGVRHRAGAEADHGAAGELLPGLVVAGEHLAQVVVHEKPRVVANERGSGGSQSTLEERRGTGRSELGHQLLNTVLALHLPVREPRGRTSRSEINSVIRGPTKLTWWS
jgi:hypothetical protein